jgi:hypothetical protein
MPAWLRGMVAPTLMLWLCVLALGVAHAAVPEGELSGRADLASRFALPFVIACWVSADARKQGKALCYAAGFITILCVIAATVFFMVPFKPE